MKAVLVIVLSLLAVQAWGESNCQRIVSLAPSTTEVAEVLGLQRQIVGVSRYDPLLEDSSAVTSIGGYLDLSLENVLRLQPDIVIALTDHHSYRDRFSMLGLPLLELDHRNHEGILASLGKVATHCAGEDSDLARRAMKISDELTESLRETKIEYQEHSGTTVLVVVASSGSFYLSGSDGFYTPLLAAIGARNLFTQKTRPFSSLSYESLVRLRPDSVILLGNEKDLEEFRTQYDRFDNSHGVRFRHFGHPAVLIPGVHFVETLKEFAVFLYPESGNPAL